MPALSFAAAMRRVVPPWLQRRVGGALMTALGTPVDTLIDRTAASIKLRFPAYNEAAIDGAALSYIGRDRKIRRGPEEDETTYARRLRLWLDSHRTRGGAYALLRQLYAYTVDWLNVRMDVVYQSGTRRWIDEAGTITADSIAWGGHGNPMQWAHAWVFFYLPATIQIGADYLVTSDGDRIVTSDGDYIVATRSITPGEITAEESAIFTSIVREWSAAHLPYITVVLLWSTRRLWNYPQPVPTWAEWGASGALWGDSPVMLIAE